MVLIVKNLPASGGGARDADLIPRSEGSPGIRNTHSNILTWKITWAEEPGRLQSMRPQRVGHD